MTRTLQIDYTLVMVWSMAKAAVTVAVIMGGWFLLSGGNAIAQIALHMLLYFVGTSILFVLLKRNEIWIDGILDKKILYNYVSLSAVLSAGSYSIGGLAVVLSGVIGPVPTAVAFVLEGIFTALYAYMDVKQQIADYNAYKKREEVKATGEQS
jgi:hypothetical protein